MSFAPESVKEAARSTCVPARYTAQGAGSSSVSTGGAFSTVTVAVAETGSLTPSSAESLTV
ncbi:hypothetical protein [Nonomuraea salmonea]|uniref:hypothetical protein n=1 Tax=Nonomuraea salmonea TaxID=46181 RepID=UPI0031F0D6A4